MVLLVHPKPPDRRAHPHVEREQQAKVVRAEAVEQLRQLVCGCLCHWPCPLRGAKACVFCNELREKNVRDPSKPMSALLLSPTIVSVSLPLLLALTICWAHEDPSYFTVWTNACFIGAGIAVSYQSLCYNIGFVGAAAFPYIFLGAASFAFHSVPQLNTPEHLLDIFFGWVLVCHCAFVSVAVFSQNLFLRLGVSPLRLKAIHLTVFALGTLLLTLEYNRVYSHQLILYFVAGPIAAFFGILNRFRLTDGECTRRAVCPALFEVGVALLTVFVAVFAQCGFAGRRFESNSPEYYIFHGHWHVLLAFATSLLYVRNADTARDVRRPFAAMEHLPAIDKVGLAALGVHALTVLVLKESSLCAWNTAQAVLAVEMVVGLGGHALGFALTTATTPLCPLLTLQGLS